MLSSGTPWLRHEASRLIGAVDLEPPTAGAELGVQGQVVEHRSEVQQLGVPAQAAVAPLQGAPAVHPKGVVVDQVVRTIPHQLSRLAGEPGVGDHDSSSVSDIEGHALPSSPTKGSQPAAPDRISHPAENPYLPGSYS